jgi:hypothetical protein
MLQTYVKHDLDSTLADLVCDLADLALSTICSAEAGLNESLAVGLKQLPCAEIRDGRDLYKLRESISDLAGGEGTKEGEVKEGHGWGVVSSKSVLQLAVVDGNLDADSGIDETDDCGGNSDEVGVSSVACTCKLLRISSEVLSE